MKTHRLAMVASFLFVIVVVLPMSINRTEVPTSSEGITYQ